MEKKIPTPPQLFFCEKCKVYFFSFSEMDKPTHSKCFTHETRKATKKEIKEINKANNLRFQNMDGVGCTNWSGKTE